MHYNEHHRLRLLKCFLAHSDPSGLASLLYQDAGEGGQPRDHSASAKDPWLASSGLEVEAWMKLMSFGPQSFLLVLRMS